MEKKKIGKNVIDKAVVKWTGAFVVTFAAILGLWKISGAALGDVNAGSPSTTPTIEAVVTDTPTPTIVPRSTATPDPTEAPTLTDTPVPTASATPEPTTTLTAVPTPAPTATTAPTATPSNTPMPTNTVAPTNTTVPTNTPLPTNTVAPTNTPVSTQDPDTAPELAIKEIVAYYVGEDRIVTNDIIKGEIEAYIIYTWDSIEPERIPSSSLTLKPGKVEKIGENTIEVWYDEYMTTITVTGIKRELVDFEAKYIGSPVYTGSTVDRAYIKAVATYNDGIREDVTDYVLLTTKINNTGVNAIKITYGGMLATIYVDGIVEEENLFKDYPIDSDETTKLTMLVSNEPWANSIYVRALDTEIVRNAVDRVVTTDKFVGFEVNYDDPEAINEFPIYTRIIRPDDYDPDAFGVYYTPNRKTIMAKVEGEYIDEEKKQYVFRIYEPGTYVMLEEISHKLVTSINVEKTYYKLKINRNISLEPVVLPTTADNLDVTYTSTDPSVAVVTKNGKVTSAGLGECDIIISACDESGVFITVHIMVVE